MHKKLMWTKIIGKTTLSKDIVYIKRQENVKI